MEVKMNKEIRDYQESMFFGLDFRQCFFSVLAILTAVGIYFGVHTLLGEEVTGWLCVLGAAPFAACGFFKYHGMNAEQFLWAVIKSEVLYPKRLLYRTENLYLSCIEETILAGEKSGKNGTVHQDGPGKIQSTEIGTAGSSHPHDMAGWDFSGRGEVFQDIPFYGY